MSIWSEVDERVLTFLAERPASGLAPLQWQLELRPTIESVDVEGLDERQVDESLRRLCSAGLIEAGERYETIGFAVWSRLRVTARGSMVRGHWPDLDQVTFLESLQVSLAALAESETDQQSAISLRRTAGILGSVSQSIALNLLTGIVADAGADV